MLGAMSDRATSPFALSDIAKDAIRTGVAMVVVFWIALRLGWDNPYWAGIAVAAISAPMVICCSTMAMAPTQVSATVVIMLRLLARF